MRPGQFTALALQPSLLSASVSVVASTLLLGAANWPSFMGQPLVHDYFLGPEGLVTLLKDPNNTAGSLFTSLFSQSNVNNVITLLVALGVGIAVLVTLEAIRRARADGGRMPPREARLRLAARLTAAAVWLGCFAITLKLILPFCIVASEVGVRAMWSIQGFAYLLFGVLLLAACFHLHVICMRAFLLRIRVFGGQEAVMRAETRV